MEALQTESIPETLLIAINLGDHQYLQSLLSPTERWNLPLQFPNDPGIVNVSHIIKSVSFGPSFPGQVNPLDGMLF